MDLTPYLDALHRDLVAAAAPGGPEVSRAADLLSTSLAASARLGLLEALSDAAAEITTRLDYTSVEVRLHGKDADFVVTDLPAPEPPAPTGPPAAEGDLSRITLRLPDSLKEQVDRAAAAEGMSVNAWLVRAVTQALTGEPGGGRVRGFGRRMTGFAQA